jgi:hypothetical protein
MFGRRSAHNDLQSFLETPDMMPNFACVEKFFTHMNLKTSGAAALFLSEAILPARNPKRKNPGAGRRVKVEAEGIPRNDLDATTGDIPWNLDLRAHDEFPAINAGFQ